MLLVGERNTGGGEIVVLPVGLGNGSSSKAWAMLRAHLRQILADWWLLKGKLTVGLLFAYSEEGGFVVGVCADKDAATLVEEEQQPSVAVSVAEDEDGERPAALVVGVETVVAVLFGPAGKALVKELQEQVGHWRGSSVAMVSVELRDLRSQCLREKTGMSKKAQ